MAKLSRLDKSRLEKLFQMSSGYVLNHTNRTFAELFADTVGVDIYDDKYARDGESKAKRLRTFWTIESDQVVGKVLSQLIDEVDPDGDPSQMKLKRECAAIAERLLGGVAVEDIEALSMPNEERTFHLLAASVRDAIDAGNPEAALDRLHTYTVKYIRQVCRGRKIDADESKPLHALIGEYGKALKASGAIESEITGRILKNSIAVMEAFNFVRNRQSLAHDNELLGKAESLLIVNHIVSIIRFIQAVERIQGDEDE